MTSKTKVARDSARALGDVPKQLALLQRMTVRELAERHKQLFNEEPTRSRNKEYLRKRLSWRVQELAEGGLSKRTLNQIAKLGDELPASWGRAPTVPATPTPTAVRDSRLPPAGTVVTRAHEGKTHRVTVLDTGFEFDGRTYRSLSAVARETTGTPWNGFTFFGLKGAVQ